MNRLVTIPAFYLNTMIFMGNAQYQDKRSTGVSPPPMWLPKNAITPGQVLQHHHAQCRGGMGEQALSPQLLYQCFVFHIRAKGILQGCPLFQCERTPEEKYLHENLNTFKEFFSLSIHIFLHLSFGI